MTWKVHKVGFIMEASAECTGQAMLRMARQYREAGIHIVPLIPRGKLPCDELLIATGYRDWRRKATWGRLRTCHPTESHLESWFLHGRANMGILPDKRYLRMLDFDYPAAFEEWKSGRSDLAGRLPTQSTGRGYHVMFRLKSSCRYDYRGPVEFRLEGREERVGEILGAGNWVTSAPSIHPTGSTYRWLPCQAPWEIGIPMLESWTELGISRPRSDPKWGRFLLRCLTQPRAAKKQARHFWKRRAGRWTHASEQENDW